MEFEELGEYLRDIKKLAKKYRTLPADIEIVKKVLTVKPEENPPHSFRIDNLGIESCIIKMKKIASKSFKNRGRQSGFRLIYGHFEEEDKIVLIELYHKSSKETEDRERIKKYFK